MFISDNSSMVSCYRIKFCTKTPIENKKFLKTLIFYSNCTPFLLYFALEIRNKLFRKAFQYSDRRTNFSILAIKTKNNVVKF